MPYLIESNEWRLLQGLGLLLDKRKARYHGHSVPLNNPKEVHPNAELFEVELRRTFMVKEVPQNLNPIDFGDCQAKLNSLCGLLDGLVMLRSDRSVPKGEVYPHLRALTGILESTSGAVDLANGPNQTLFRLPDGVVELSKCLRIVTECNDTLSRLLASPLQESAVQPFQKQQKKRMWKKARIRNRATFVLEALFERFRCGTPHEVLLKLIEDPDEDSVLPSLQLMLSPCPDLEPWQEVRCDSVYLYVWQLLHS